MLLVLSHRHIRYGSSVERCPQGHIVLPILASLVYSTCLYTCCEVEGSRRRLPFRLSTSKYRCDYLAWGLTAADVVANTYNGSSPENPSHWFSLSRLNVAVRKRRSSNPANGQCCRVKNRPSMLWLSVQRIRLLLYRVWGRNGETTFDVPATSLETK